MLTFPFCKINLGLHIINKRPDGFHNIETVFYPVETITDVLEIIPSEQFDFQCFGVQIDGKKEDNLVVKAYNLMKQHYHLPPVSIFLLKNIPAGAGLGGGSSDAAFALKLINTLFKLDLNDEKLKEYASQLGSDCSFFIDNVPAIGQGKGNELVPCVIPQLSEKQIVIVTPDVFVSTAEAYKSCKPTKRTTSLSEIISQPLHTWKDLLVNDFEKTVFPLYPQLQKIKENLYQQGAVYASLSGSGGALYGIFDEKWKRVKTEGKMQYFHKNTRCHETKQTIDIVCV